MNINDIEDQESPLTEDDIVEAIFDRQRELMSKYHSIEERNGFHVGEDIPLNLDDKRDQHRIKDFSWRIMEEVAEALDCMEDEKHFHEELIDGLHFLVELMILTGIEAKFKLNVNIAEPTVPYIKFWRELGNSMNCLKNKPWKQTHMVTDRTMFFFRLRVAWAWYMIILSQAGLTNSMIYNIYMKKSEVNKFRQRSNY